MARLDFDAVTKIYRGPVSALDRFTLAVSEGELAVLVGLGAGKTTALRIAAGLERATSGSIRLDGERIDEWRPKDRDMAMVFQEPSLYPHLTVRKNARVALRMRHTSRRGNRPPCRPGRRRVGHQPLTRSLPRDTFRR